MRSKFEKQASKLIFGDEGWVPTYPNGVFELISDGRMVTYNQLVQELALAEEANERA